MTETNIFKRRFVVETSCMESIQIESMLGYLNTLAGNMNRALIKPKTPSTAKPNILKGNNINQIMGYNKRNATASGQQITNRINQSSNFIFNYTTNDY